MSDRESIKEKEYAKKILERLQEVNKEMTGVYTYDVQYFSKFDSIDQQWYGKTVASNLYNKGGEIKKV